MAHARSLRVRFRFNLGRFCILIAAFFCSHFTLSANTPPALLTNAADVLSLSAEQASNRIPVRVRGVVTAAEPTWNGQFFVQDDTSGVFVENRSDAQPKPGDLVEVSGVSQPGAFAPIISMPTWTILGTAPLPKAKRVSLEQLMSGLEDGQRIEVSGIVRAVTPAVTALDVEIASGGNRIHIFPRQPANIDPQSLVGAHVRVRGTLAASFNQALRHLVTVVMFVPMTNDFIIEQMEGGDPFAKPLIPLSGIAEYRRDIKPGQRVHVRGVVTLQRPGQDLFLQDASGGLHIQTRQTNQLAVGDVVDVVGFPDLEHSLPVLNDSVFRKSAEKLPPVEPNNKATIAEIMTGFHHSELISIEAKVLDRTVHRNPMKAGAFTTALLLQARGLVFTAEADAPKADARLAAIPIGSVVEATGVCFTESGEDKKLHSMELLLADSGNVRILQQPSWFTPERLLVSVAILLAILVVAVCWSVLVSKKNSALRELIRERETAQIALQEAHDQLEERVKERTAQLKFQITARKESEVQFKAVLNERTRLAQELHDTVEQSLTGIALQLDTTSKLFETRPDGASHHLEMARSLVSQSQVDVRRSVWDLRSRALEQFDLPGALLTSGKQMTDGTNVQLEVSAKGQVRPLPETVEENLLRIAQESLTNIIKHSGATSASIELDYGAQNIILQIKDNGRGFEREKSAGPVEGHFGLLGMTERAKRLGGDLSVTSEPGHGTTVRLQAPIDQSSDVQDLAPSEAVLE